MLYSPHIEVYLGIGPTLYALVIKNQGKQHREGVCTTPSGSPGETAYSLVDRLASHTIPYLCTAIAVHGEGRG